MSAENTTPRRHQAGLFDIRNIIGLLLLIYGVALVVMGMGLTSRADLDKVGGINANLWVGICLVVAGVIFGLWARLRPIVVDEVELAEDRAAAEERGRPSTH
jgi:hypothetical protein